MPHRNSSSFWQSNAGQSGKDAMAMSERKEVRHPSMEAERFASLGQVAGELIHDLANVMAVVHGRASLALGDARAGRPPTAELERLVEATEDMGSMLRDVLETLRGSRLSPEVLFDPVKLAQRVVNRFVDSAPTIEIRMEGTLPPEMLVPGRSSFLARALLNLLNNAARFAHSEIRITFSLLEGEPLPLSVVVEDDGPGIEPTLLPGVFRPLVQGEAAGAAGSGLSSVSWSMQQLTGEVRYRDGSALGGAAFEMRLPAVLKRRRRQLPPQDALRGQRLVLLEDDPAVQRLLVRILGRMGAETCVCNPSGISEEEVLHTVLRAMPDAILLDLRLGVRTGTEIWYALREQLPSLAQRVVFLSALTPGDPDWDAAEATGQPILAKPLDVDELITTLAELVRRGDRS
jgi:two-component system, cell cycle sensor histidine kinase and response regulator CckA